MTDPKNPSSTITSEVAPATDESKPQGFGVAASPFNGVKMELGFTILLGIVLWLAADSITANETTQWLMLLVYSLLSMAWLVLRTRAVLRRCLKSGEMTHETHE